MVCFPVIATKCYKYEKQLLPPTVVSSRNLASHPVTKELCSIAHLIVRYNAQKISLFYFANNARKLGLGIWSTAWKYKSSIQLKVIKALSFPLQERANALVCRECTLQVLKAICLSSTKCLRGPYQVKLHFPGAKTNGHTTKINDNRRNK